MFIVTVSGVYKWSGQVRNALAGRAPRPPGTSYRGETEHPPDRWRGRRVFFVARPVPEVCAWGGARRPRRARCALPARPMRSIGGGKTKSRQTPRRGGAFRLYGALRVTRRPACFGKPQLNAGLDCRLLVFHGVHFHSAFGGFFRRRFSGIGRLGSLGRLSRGRMATEGAEDPEQSREMFHRGHFTPAALSPLRHTRP